MKEKKKIGMLALTLLFLAGLVYLMWKTGFFSSISSLESLQDYIGRWRPYSHFVFFGIQFASVVLAPIPSNITAAAGAVLFGVLPAFLLTVAAVFSGSLLVFVLARGLGRPFADKFMSERVSDKYLSLIKTKRDSFLILAFLFPFFPDDLLCILAGLTDIPLRRFAVITALTRPWGLLVACAVGGSVIRIPWWGMLALGAAGLLLFLAGLKYGDKIEASLLARLRRK